MTFGEKIAIAIALIPVIYTMAGAKGDDRRVWLLVSAAVLLITFGPGLVASSDFAMLSSLKPSPAAKTVYVEYGNTTGNIVNDARVCAKGDWVYYISNLRPNICRVKADGSGWQQLNDSLSGDINVVGEWVYYTNHDDSHRIYRVKTDGSEQQKISDDGASQLSAVGDWLYYVKKPERDVYGPIYRIKTDGSVVQKLNNVYSININVVGDWIYFSNHSDGDKLYRLKTDGSEQEKISDDKIDNNVTVVGDWAYYQSPFTGSLGGQLWRIKIDGSEQQKITDEKYWAINVVGNWIYCVHESSFYIYRIKTDGSEYQKIGNEKSFININVAGDWVYYYDLLTFSRIKTDGSVVQIVQ